MNLVIFHYHLNRGGVTRVIENHLRALATLELEARPARVLIVYGGRAADWPSEIQAELPFEIQLAVVPELEYDSRVSESQAAAKARESDLLRAVDACLKSHNCSINASILHVHNHSLGKNAAWPRVLANLARAGWKLLLQLHDFAEDLRPQNYRHLLAHHGDLERLHESLYPQGNQIHYAALNRRDADLLLAAGLAAERMQLLPNPVIRFASQESSDELHAATRKSLNRIEGVPLDHAYIVYPVRGIQRKNLGEFLLWASVCSRCTFAITLPPINPREQRQYAIWKDLAKELSLPILFEAGSRLSLAENYAAANAILTTSVAEGFGMAFLEASLMDRPLVGRDLPGITGDFREAGMSFPGLSSKISVPNHFVNAAEATETVVKQTVQLREDFGIQMTDVRTLQAAARRLFDQDKVDFGRLGSHQQAEILRSFRQDPSRRERVLLLNPAMQLAQHLGSSPEEKSARRGELMESARSNAAVIQEHYSLRGIADRLGRRYAALMAESCGEVTTTPHIAQSLQHAFLDPSQIYPIRLEI